MSLKAYQTNVEAQKVENIESLHFFYSIWTTVLELLRLNFFTWDTSSHGSLNNLTLITRTILFEIFHLSNFTQNTLLESIQYFQTEQKQFGFVKKKQ